MKGKNAQRKSWYCCSVLTEKIKGKKEFEISASTSPELVSCFKLKDKHFKSFALRQIESKQPMKNLEIFLAKF